MDCGKVRDQFSSLFEGELKPLEEEKVREHLGSCQDCEKEWKEFRQMMGWLHAVEEEEVPGGFLSELQKKREERKRKERRGGDQFFRSMKIPVQAVAMVMIVFLALYLSNMAPFEMLQKRAVEKSEVPQSEVQKKEAEPVSPPPLKIYPEKYRAEAKSSVVDEKKSIPPAPPLKEEMATAEPLRPKEMVKAEAPPLEEKKRESERVGTVMMSLAKKPAREITLKISDREKAVSQVQELAKQLGGEMVREDGSVLLASLPVSSYGEFEKGLAQIGSSPVFPKATVPKEMKDDSSLAAGTKSKEPIFIRIHLVPE
ncbi:MAG: zf-HC2 domain-containing protein [Thermodesulfobacteriota bacterium]|nr:zf-HC2 domain-containing protein [Thermodesulfobacteriota bacterium]